MLRVHFSLDSYKYDYLNVLDLSITSYQNVSYNCAGDKALVRFRFIKNPEYLRTDMKMVFREGRTKAIGTVCKLHPHVTAVAQNTRQQRAAKKAEEKNHQLRPQNEPQKPSKRNRRMRHKAPQSIGEASKENLHLMVGS